MAEQVNIVINAKDNASGPINKVSGAFNNISSIASGIIAAGALQQIGSQLTAIAQNSLTAASDLEETTNKVKVVFGDAADAVLAFGEDAATAMGMSEKTALDAAGTFGNLFTSMGLTTDASADMSTGLVQLASDLASFNNIDPTVALEKLRAGLVGEVEPLRTLGVNLSAAEVDAKALAMGLAETADQLTAADKAQARYALILEQTTNAQGDFTRTSEGLANSTRILKAQFADVSAELGQQLLPLALQVATGLRDLMNSFSELSPAVQQFVTTAGALLLVLGPVLVFVGQVAAAIAAIGPVVSALAGVISGPLVVGIGAAVAVVAGWIYTWSRWYEDAMKIWNWVSTTFGPLWEAFAGVIGALVNLALTAMAGIWQNVVMPALRTAWEWLAQKLSPVFEAIASFLNRVFGPAIKVVGDWINNTLTPAFRSLTGVLEKVVAWLENIKRRLEALKNGLPDWMTPGSPTPWEIGLVGVADAMRQLSRTELPRLEASMKMDGPAVAQGEGLTGRAAVTRNVNNYYQLTINEAGQRGNVVNDFALVQALAGTGG